MRIKNRPGETGPRIQREAMLSFFERRAERVGELGPTCAVIYQDKTPELASRRDAAEKALLTPKTGLDETSRLLDVGCGTGRWAEALGSLCGSYVGVDFSPGLVRVARERFRDQRNMRFVVCSADQISFEHLEEAEPFSNVLLSGVLIYLNDDEVLSTLRGILSVSAPACRVLIREPVGLLDRLTLKEHFSEDLDQIYNAIYRTEEELVGVCDSTLGKDGFRLSEYGDVYHEMDLNNRADTRQRWYVWDRSF